MPIDIFTSQLVFLSFGKGFSSTFVSIWKHWWLFCWDCMILHSKWEKTETVKVLISDYFRLKVWLRVRHTVFPGAWIQFLQTIPQKRKESEKKRRRKETRKRRMEEIGNQEDCNGITRKRPKLKRIRIRKLLRKKKSVIQWWSKCFIIISII